MSDWSGHDVTFTLQRKPGDDAEAIEVPRGTVTVELFMEELDERILCAFGLTKEQARSLPTESNVATSQQMVEQFRKHVRQMWGIEL